MSDWEYSDESCPKYEQEWLKKHALENTRAVESDSSAG